MGTGSAAYTGLIADLRGASRLAIEATTGVTGLVEAMHGTIAGLGRRSERTRGITGFVYRCIGGVTGLVGEGLDAALAPLHRLAAAQPSSAGREALVAALNGVVGDHLTVTGNPLAISMSLRHGGKTLELTNTALRAALPGVTERVLIQVHGLCMNDLQWARGGRDHGAAIARELGYTRLHLRYNSGLGVARNGREFAALLEVLLRAWPVRMTELAVVAHSMGGLIARSAHCHATAAGHEWPARVRRLIFLGTPHHGAPLERAGNGLDLLLGLSPYTLPFTRLGRIRSAGITDLRHGSLLDQDWEGSDRHGRVSHVRRIPVPLPEGVACYAVAAVRAQRADTLASRLVGDGLVPVDSALGVHANARYALRFPPSHQWLACGTGHLDLMSNARVFERVARWLAAPGAPRVGPRIWSDAI